MNRERRETSFKYPSAPIKTTRQISAQFALVVRVQPARIVNKSFDVTLIFARLTDTPRKKRDEKEKNPAEDFTRRLLYPAVTAKAPRKITQVGRPAGRASERVQSGGGLQGVPCSARGRDNKEQVVARARSYSRHPCHVGPLVGLEETVRRVEEENDEAKDAL